MKNKKYDIQYTNKFKKQYNKLLKNPNFKKEAFETVFEYLSNGEQLPEKYRNHLLIPKSERNMGMSCSTRCIIRISKIKRQFNNYTINYR